MTSMFRECSCKQEDCNLKFSIKGCKHISVWKVKQRGTHPVLNDVDIKSYGLPALILELVTELLIHNIDAKANEILLSLTLKIKNNMILMNQNSIKTIKNADYIPDKQHNNRYIFPIELLPSLTQVCLCLFF